MKRVLPRTAGDGGEAPCGSRFRAELASANLAWPCNLIARGNLRAARRPFVRALLSSPWLSHSRSADDTAARHSGGPHATALEALPFGGNVARHSRRGD